jgi:hypothetical protein
MALKYTIKYEYEIKKVIGDWKMKLLEVFYRLRAG